MLRWDLKKMFRSGRIVLVSSGPWSSTDRAVFQQQSPPPPTMFPRHMINSVLQKLGERSQLCAAWKPGETGNKRILTRTKKNNNNAPLLPLNDPRPVVLDYTTSTFNSFVPLKADATFCLTDSVSHPSHFQSQCCRQVFSGEFWPTRHKCFYARSWSPCTLARHIPSTYRGYVCNILHPAHVGVIN